MCLLAFFSLDAQLFLFLELSLSQEDFLQLLELGLSFHTSPGLSLDLSEIGGLSHELDLSPEVWTLKWTWTFGHAASLQAEHRFKKGICCSTQC